MWWLLNFFLKKRNSQTERIMLKETSIMLGKNSNPVKKKKSIDNKILYRTQNQYTIQYLQMLCIQYSSLFT